MKRSTLLRVVEQKMLTLEPGTEEYNELLSTYVSISGADAKAIRSIDPNTVLIVVGNLIGILALLAFEQSHVLTSKATGFIMKPKL